MTISLSKEEFAAQQASLKAAGHPDDPCHRCGCRRKHHRPPPTFSYAKSGGSSGKSREIPVLAPTCCHCPFCFCSCVAFVEPEWGQKWEACLYESDQVQP